MPDESVGRRRPPREPLHQPHAHARMHGRVDSENARGAAPRKAAVAASRMCICVDDYGLSDGISAAGLQLVAAQRVQALGCMVGAPVWRAWSDEARALATTGVDTGLHLDLTEFPLLATTRKPLAHWIVQAYVHGLDRTAVRAEIRAQLDAFEDSMGRAPAYIDGHQHVHQLPGVRAALVAEMLARYGRAALAMPWLRATTVDHGVVPEAHGGWMGWGKSRAVAALGSSGLSALARMHGIPQNRVLLGVYAFNADHERYMALLAAAMRVGGDAALLMCHPSLGGGRVPDAHSAARLVEYAALQSPALGRVLTAEGVRLQPMSRILAARAAGPAAP